MQIGVDVGGTKTHVLMADNGHETELVVPTASWCQGSLLDDAANPVRLIRVFLDRVEHPERTPVVVGAHGCDGEVIRAEFERRLRQHYPGPVRALNDAALLAPAHGVAHAIAVVIGTGSIVLGSDQDGQAVVAGGYGAVLGDPGSAPALVRDAVRAVLVAHDRGEVTDPLAERLMAHYGVADTAALALTIGANVSLAHWGSGAPVVFEAAAAGSRIAWEVVDAAAAELATSVHHVTSRGALGTTVVAAGGVVTHQPLVLDRLRHHVSLLEPALRVELLAHAPVRGALTLAHQLTGSTRTMVQGGIHEASPQAV